MAWPNSFYPDLCVTKHVIDAVETTLDIGKTHCTMPISDSELR
jgi:hypothetical protein